jgi:GNAT superfamily N-acetyltransferase
MLADLLGQGGPCSRCWCMYWRIGPAYRKRTAQTNKSAFKKLVRDGPPPGLLAMLGNEAVGWCQLTRRHDLPHLDRVQKLRTVDKQPVWSISCFYIRKGYRKKGITAVLIEAAIRAAKKNGAPALEAYPLDAKLTPSSSWTGYASTFLRAGFKLAARHFPPQPVMRLQLRKGSS